MAWKIRFCSGLNQGVEVTLAPGRLVIGSDPSLADLVLVDPGVAAEHLVLDVDEAQVRVLEWAQAHLPTQDGEAVVVGDALQAFALQACGVLHWMFCADEQVFEQAGGKQVAVLDKAANAKRGGWWSWALGIGCVALLALLVTLMLVLLLSSWGTSSTAVQQPAPTQRVEAYLRQQGMADVTIAAGQAGEELVLGGHLRTDQQLADLQRFMEGSGMPFRLAVSSQEDIRRDVDSILPRLGYKGASADGEQVGWVRLEGGGAVAPERWQQIVQTLQSDVQGLLGVEAQPAPAADPLQELRQWLDTAGLADQLSIARNGERIELSGALDARQQDAFKQVEDRFAAAFPAMAPLLLKSTEPARPKPTVQFPIKAVSVGRVPYVILANNQRYPIDGITPTGVRVVEIRSDRVVVSKQGQQFIINLKGDGGNDQ
ncbi:type III secretion system inner membrane ring subunit SctD [Pseudomonas entomophila]|uniref:type III secretion system inner membrane ring subunit SctD n=1 Tax=Pseudomonas entomophila TaxID=312306 RepID=UPI001F015542|nr:type III secretion system inner membrane ring subunit SctD [Pseudomonas entomophila]MCG8291436.1 type III secretion system inner membrane ring subunit SctD [Pseudomonas entomophila]